MAQLQRQRDSVYFEDQPYDYPNTSNNVSTTSQQPQQQQQQQLQQQQQQQQSLLTLSGRRTSSTRPSRYPEYVKPVHLSFNEPRDGSDDAYDSAEGYSSHQRQQQQQQVRQQEASALDQTLSNPLIPAMSFIPFPVNVGWFVHFVKDHIYEEDEVSCAVFVFVLCGEREREREREKEEEKEEMTWCACYRSSFLPHHSLPRLQPLHFWRYCSHPHSTDFNVARLLCLC